MQCIAITIQFSKGEFVCVCVGGGGGSIDFVGDQKSRFENLHHVHVLQFELSLG